MDLFLHQILAGLATGGIYASVALALVMIYQATHLVNFAQGEIAMFATYLAWTLMQAGVPYWGAFFITVVAAFIGGGLLVIFNSIAGWIYSYTIKPFPSPFPAEPLFGNSYVTSHELGSTAVTLIV